MATCHVCERPRPEHRSGGESGIAEPERDYAGRGRLDDLRRRIFRRRGVRHFDRLAASLASGRAGEVCCYDPGSGVWAIVPDGDVVYLGGAFARVGRTARPFAAKVTAGTGRVLAWDTRPNGPVLGIGRIGGDILLAGGLTSVNVEPRFGLMAIDGPSGQLLPWTPRFSGRYGPGSGANALAISASRLFVGGNFKAVNGRPRKGFAAFDLTSGVLAEWSPALGDDPTDGVTALVATGDAVVAGGDFTDVAAALDDSFEPRVAAAALAADNGDVLDWNPRPSRGDGHSGGARP